MASLKFFYVITINQRHSGAHFHGVMKKLNPSIAWLSKKMINLANSNIERHDNEKIVYHCDDVLVAGKQPVGQG